MIFENRLLGHGSIVTGLVLSLALSPVSGSKFPSESVALTRSSDEQFVFCYQLKLKRIK